MNIVPYFNKDEAYTGMFSLSFWVYYISITEFPVFGIVMSILGIASIINLAYYKHITELNRLGVIKSTDDLSNFMHKNKLFWFFIILGLFYNILTIVYGIFIINSDDILYFIWILCIIALIYNLTYALLICENRRKVMGIIKTILKLKLSQTFK